MAKKSTEATIRTGIRFETYVDSSSEYRWRMVDGNNRIVGASGEGFTRRADAQRAIQNVIADILDGKNVQVQKAKAAK
jgi:uncharacterized protein YegP (UPF0339 family)